MEPNRLQPPDLNSPSNFNPGINPLQPQAPQEDFSEKHTWFRVLQERNILIPLIVVILVPLIFAFIVYRYDIYGLFKKQNFSVEIVDSKTLQPLINATVTTRGQTVKTNNYGVATFSHIKVGHSVISLSHQYYHSSKTTTLITYTNHNYHIFGLSSSETQVHISITNKITQKPINGVLITTMGNSVMTNNQGIADISLPSSALPLPTTLSVTNYNSSTAAMSTSLVNNYTMEPSGSVYYLSNALGPISLLKSNIDGSGQQLVNTGSLGGMPATSKISFSHDSKYIAYVLTDNTNTPTLYVYNTSNNKTTKIAQSAIGFNLDGWTHDNILVFTSIVNNQGNGEGNGSNIQAYNTGSNNPKPYILDNSGALGYDASSGAQENYSSVIVLSDDNVVFTKYWTGSTANVSDNPTTLNSVPATQTTYTGPTPLESLNSSADYATPPKIAQTSTTSIDYGFTNSSNNSVKYYTFSGGKASSSTASSIGSILNSPPLSSAYFLSPSGNHQMWSHISGNTVSIIVGDKNGNNQNTVANLPFGYVPYGWWSDDYLLLSKGSTLYIIPSTDTGNEAKIQQVSVIIPYN